MVGETSENYTAAQNYYNNQGYNTAGALQIRLDTRSIIDDFQVYLRGQDVRTITDPETGEAKNITIWKGKRIVNDQGYQAIMRWIHLILNSQVIQGNFIDEEYFGEYMMNLRKDFWNDMIINRHEFGIELKTLPGLSSSFMNCAYLILTRPIFNKERDGMNNSVKTVESVQTQANKGFFNMPMFGGGKK